MTAPDQTNAEVSDERLREIIEGCEGVTPGPWESDGVKNDGFTSYEVTDQHGKSVVDAFNAGVIEIHEEEGRSWDEQGRKNLRHIASLDPATVKALATELLTRRSVTSQASEGEVVAWQGDAPDGRRGLTSNSKVAEMWKDVGRTVTPLYASPSKRVERLETALRDVINEVLNVSSASYIREPVLTMAIQALQGGRA